MFARGPKRLTPVLLFEVPAASASGGAEVLVRLEPFTRPVPELAVFGAHTLPQPRPSVPVPASFVARLRGALVAGVNSGVTFGRRVAIPCPDYAFEHRAQLFAEYFEGEGSRRTLRDNPRLRSDRRLERGVLVSSRYSHNYFHFLVEALQAACLAERVESSAPLVIDGRVPAQARELLAMIAPGRELLTVPAGEFWRFDELLLAVTGAFSPDEPELAPIATFDTRLLGEVRARVWASVPADEPTEIMYVSRRRYLAPLAGRAYTRDAVNSLELEEHVRALGGRVIFPEELSGTEQAAAFRAAHTVILPTGSAVANTIFCEPSTSIITLHQNRLVNPWYFAPLASELDLRWRFAVGDPDTVPAIPQHASYTIPIATLDAAIAPPAASTSSSKPQLDS